MALVDVARGDRAHGVERPGDAEHVGDALGGVQALPQQIDGAGAHEGAGCRGLCAGDEREQCRFARPVAADEPGAAGAERARDIGQGGRAVGPGEGDAVEGDRGSGDRHDVPPEGSGAGANGTEAPRAHDSARREGPTSRRGWGAPNVGNPGVRKERRVDGSARDHSAASKPFNGLPHTRDGDRHSLPQHSRADAVAHPAARESIARHPSAFIPLRQGRCAASCFSRKARTSTSSSCDTLWVSPA